MDEFYEGSEKLLEVWFPCTLNSVNDDPDLRNIDRKSINKILNKVNCEILNVIKDSSQVAYLLSESSLFVTRNTLILKTCGTTTLLNAFDELLDCAQDVGFNKEESLVFYSRRKFVKPGLQSSPHHCFTQEASVLQKYYPDGIYHAFGALNDECWYLFLSERDIKLRKPDQTFELIMSELDPEAMTPFFEPESGEPKQDATKVSGIDTIFEGKRPLIDDHLFSPCGYSMNGLLGNEHYYTIHITPQQAFSYASFETNQPMMDYTPLLEKVLMIFRPKHVLLSLFANETSVAKEALEFPFSERQFGNYRRLDYARSSFGTYELVFTRLLLNSQKEAP